MKKRIAIDARMISHSGIGVYLESLISKLIQNDDFSWNLLGDLKVLSGIFPKTKVTSVGSPIYSLAEQFAIAPKARSIDLFHSPHYNAPLMMTKPLVVTIHDLTHFRFPEYFGSSRKVKSARALMTLVLKKAAKIIAVSHATKLDLMEMFHVAESGITVIQEAASSKIKKVIDIEEIIQYYPTFHLKPNYFLYLGNLKAHKNILRLLRAFRSMREEGLEEELLIVGKLDVKTPGAEVIKTLLEAPYIHYLGAL